MKTKAAKPVLFFSSKTAPIIKAYFEFVQLKQLFRQGWLRKNIPEERCESVAEHTFAVAVIAMFLAETYFPEMDLLKILKMSLIHDFGEIEAGDIIPADGISPEQKHDLEKESLSKVLSWFQLNEEYLRLWIEFENGTSPEAQFVRQLDKLEMALQASVYQHQGFGDLSDFYRSAAKSISIPELESILKEIQALV